MLNSTTAVRRQTQMRPRRAVGEALMPTLVRLAECSDRDLARQAKRVVLALYGETIHRDTITYLRSFSADELETVLDVMGTRGVEPHEVAEYLTLYLGPKEPIPVTSHHRVAARPLLGQRMAKGLIGLEALAAIRDASPGSTRGEYAQAILTIDMLDRFPTAVRASLVDTHDAALRGLIDQMVEQDVPAHMIQRLVEATI